MKIFIIILFANIVCLSAQEDKNVQPFLVEHIKFFPNVRDLALYNKTGEAIFSIQNYVAGQSVLVQSTLKDGKWHSPEILSFSGFYNDLEPFFSSNGLNLYFASNRPIDSTSTNAKDFDIWVVSRKDLDSEWEQPINIGRPINTEQDEFYPAITDSGNMYFTTVKKDSKTKDDIYVSIYTDGRYQQPIELSDSINSEGYEFNAYVAPDETYLIFSGYNRDDGFGSGDLYISYRDENGDWTKAKNLGKDINSSQIDYCPFVDSNNNLLYYTSKRLNLKKENKPITLEELLKWKSQSDGLSKLYRVDFSRWIKRKN